MTFEYSNIEDLKKGQLINKIRGGKPSKTYHQYMGYCRLNRAYQLDDYEDISKCSYHKKGTKVITNI